MTQTERERRDRFDTAFGAWVRERLAAQRPDRWTQQRLRDELAQRGYEVKREWLNQVIGGKRPSDDLRSAIERLLGEFPEPSVAEPVSADLAAAIRDQARALTALVGELQKWRTEDRKRLADVERVLDRLVASTLDEPDTTKPAAPPVRDGTTV